MTRTEKEARARELRAQGLILREIAAEMGVAISTVDAWLNDPGGLRLKARKDSYRGRCVNCGAPTDGSYGVKAAPERCLRCYTAKLMADTRERDLAALHRWVALYGSPPQTPDWNPNLARVYGHEARAVRFIEGDWPWEVRIRERWGTWNSFIRAGGYEPTLVGRYDRAEARRLRAERVGA